MQALIKAMTTEEKYTFVGGGGMGVVGDAGNLPGVGRLGVPQIKMYDGPCGIYYMTDSTNPPIEEMLAATWDKDMAYEYGNMVSKEAKAIGAGMMLSAQLDLQRIPQFSRTKDQLGEDPYLINKMGAQLVAGMQSEGGIAVLKHFIAYTEGSNNDVLSEQALHEVYLKAFEGAVKDANALGIMSSYNLINGIYASANTYIQQDVLRDMWGYDYFTITDWGGNHEYTVDKGTDIEMPRLNLNNKEAADALVADGTYTQEEMDAMIDQSLARILRAYGQAGYLTLVQLDEDGNVKEEVGRTEPIYQLTTEDTVQQLAELLDSSNAVSQAVAEQGAVLLKNEEATLPIADGESVAVIGVTGTNLASGTGGERSYGTLSSMTSPYAALQESLGAEKVTGVAYNDIIGTPIPADCFYTSEDGEEHGVTRTYGVAEAAGTTAELQGFAGGGGFGSAAVEDTAMEGHEIGEVCQIDENINFTTGTINGAPNKTYRVAGADEGTATAFPYDTLPAYTWEGYIEAPEDGVYTISQQSIGGVSYMYLYDGEDVVVAGKASSTARQGSQWHNSIVPSETGMDVQNFTVELKAGQRYKVVLQALYKDVQKDLQVSLNWITPSQKQANIDASIEAAKTNDKVVVFAYATSLSNTKTATREEMSMQLSEDQEEMINTIAAAAHEAGNKVAVVLNATTAVVMGDWLDNVDAVLDMYYPGQRGGYATANLLTGAVNPSGKLAFTIPKEDSDTLITNSDQAWALYQTVTNEAINQKTTIYYEGINVGYKWFDEEEIEPQFDFGYGLSYTDFEYSDLVVTEAPAEGEEIGYDVTFTITNVGDVTGSEIAQLYLGEADVPAGLQSSKYTLAGFEKVKDIEPGESREVTIHVPERELSYWNTPQTELNEREDGTKDKWTVATGERTIYVGAASDNLLLEETVDIQ
ncbi:MAG: glycoside hydrolase family 3 C-terminal domain-containing protein [Lachnospiraceae bacterium]|nr:glycoside hydrolase family 3 C-terminal domain-containing protein [Lachnospiraceae bacterium]